MAIKTFTTGEVLTAADTNTYLTNSGLVYVKQQTVGSGVTSVEVTAAFSAAYDNYRIIYMGGTSTAQSDLKVFLGNVVVATGYYQTCIYAAYGSATVLGQVTSNGANWPYSGGQDTPNSLSMEVFNPFATEKTVMESSFIGVANGRVAGRSQGFYNATTSYTSLTIAVTSGNITGGIVYVYGYRKA